MDYQPMNQTTEQGSSMKMWWIIGTIIVVVAAAWYFYGSKAPVPSAETSTVGQTTQSSPLTAGNTTADISADLSQTADAFAALDADAAASAQAVSGF